jgi:S1-C subfamily serine protease
VPVRLFIISLAIIVALLAGFFAGRAYERSTRYDVYWLLGATIDGDLDGPYLDMVYPGGPASQAGLRHGDHIGAIDGRPVTTADQARRMFGEYEPGDTVQLTIRRDGHVEQVPVMLGFIVVVRPEPVDPTVVIVPVDPPAPPPVPNTYREGRLGVYYQMLEPGDPLGDHGALIMMVWAGSPAEREGLMVGDIILEVEGTDLTQRLTLEDALSRYSSGERVSLRVRTADGHTRTIYVVLS